MIQIARIYEPARKNGGWRVLVDRLWPRGVNKENAHVDLCMNDIAPSAVPRKWFGTNRNDGRRAELAKKRELAELKQAEKNARNADARVWCERQGT